MLCYFFIIIVLFSPPVLVRWVLSKASIKEKDHECNWTNRWAIPLSGSNWTWEALALWLQKLRCVGIPIHFCADCVQRNPISFLTWLASIKISIFNIVCYPQNALMHDLFNHINIEMLYQTSKIILYNCKHLVLTLLSYRLQIVGQLNHVFPCRTT